MPARVASREMSSPVVIHHQLDQHKHNLRNRFELLKTLGQGTYGKVKLAIDRITGDEVAIKYIKKTKVKSEQDLVRIRREIDIMANLSHPHITTIYEVFENKEKIILVMEYASGGELYDYINEKQGLDEEEARKFFRQIVSAVQYLHKNGIVHRDLKLENIVMDHMGDIKIADFGLANVYSDDSMLQTFCGSPLYASPEIVNGLPYYGPEVDCWSLGVLLYTIVYGAMPFDGSDFRKLRNQITTGKYYEPENASECAGLIRSILTVNPEKRADIKDIGNHWWVNLGYKYTPMADVRTLLCEETNFRDQENSLTLSSSTDSDSDCELSPTHQNDPVQSVPRKGILKKPKVESLDAVFSGAEDHEEKVDLKQMQKEHFEQELYNDSLDELDIAEERQSSLIQSNENINDTNQNVHSGEAVRVVPESVFDCNKKPKRGILKNKHKYTGSDSGCIIVDLPSKGRASSTSSDLPLQESHSPEGHDDTYDLTDIEAVLNEVETAETSSEAIMKHPSVGKYAQNYDYDDSETSPTNTHFSPDINIEENNIVRRRKGILKKHSKYSSEYDPTNRYSYGSTGSNSSGDILDFSYDSLDEESYMQKHCVPLSLQIHQDLPQKQSICDEDYTKNCNGFEEAETIFGADFDTDSLEQNSPEQDIFHKIQSLDGAICGIQKNSSDSDLFNLEEAQLVYSQALQICKETQ